MHLISNISKNCLVRGLPNFKFEKDKVCDACQMGKQTKSSFKSKNVISTSRPLQLLYMDLFGPSRITSYGGNYYAFVIVDDFSRFTWVLMIKRKDDALKSFITFAKRVQNQKGFFISKIRSDHGGEFDNVVFKAFCEENGFSHDFSSPRTPQQNGVAERKNRTLQEFARLMLNEYGLPKYFWVKAVNTACYVLNRVLVRSSLDNTLYEL
ncbi:hypothetical protein IC575_014263 [Cucumis melo]